MKLKTFKTHTFALIKEVEALEYDFNIWANDKDIEIIRTDYFVNQRKNKSNMKYEELTLFVFYEVRV